MKEKSNQKISMKAIIIIVIVVIVLIAIFSDSNESSSSQINNSNNNTTQESDSNSNEGIEEENKYMTSLEWTNSGNENSDEEQEWLKVAVENDSYDGDILQSGTYIVRQTDGEYNGTPQRTYNLYVTELNTDNPEEVQNNSLPITVGGVNGSENEIIVKKGQYLYIQKVSGGEIGHLKLELK